MRYHVNGDCIGCGLCTGICPEVFSMVGGVSEAKEEAEAAQKPASSQHAFGATPGIFSALLGTAANTQKEEIQEENEAINGAALLQALLNARR